MSQYQPVHKAGEDSRIYPVEFLRKNMKTALKMTQDLGIETVFTQDLEEELHNLPNFCKSENPFPLDRAILVEGIEAG